MASSVKNSLNLNLFSEQGQSSKFWANLLRWLVSSGNFLIVIFIEAIVIVALVLKYIFTSQLATLDEKIDSQVAFIKARQAEERQIRKTQFQLASIKQIKNEGPNFTELISAIAGITPQNTILTSVVFEKPEDSPKTTFTIDGNTNASLEVAALLNALKKDDRLGDVNLANFSIEEETTVFSITGTLIKGGN